MEFERKFYMKIIVTIIPIDLVYIPFLSFHRNQKQESNFQQTGGLVTRNSFYFCYFKGMPNSIDFYKRIFFHIILVRIVVPWFCMQGFISPHSVFKKVIVQS